MAMQSFCAEITLDDPKADYKTAEKIEQYRVSNQAIYIAAFPGSKYLPFSAISHAWVKNASISLTGCCGKELPVTVLRVRYEGGFFQNITFEKEKNAARALQKILQNAPQVSPEAVGA